MKDQPKAKPTNQVFYQHNAPFTIWSRLAGYIGCKVEVEKTGVIWTCAALSSLITTSPQKYDGAATEPDAAEGLPCLPFRVWWHERRKFDRADARHRRIHWKCTKSGFLQCAQG